MTHQGPIQGRQLGQPSLSAVIATVALLMVGLVACGTPAAASPNHTTARVSSALPGADDLTFGGSAGDALVGLTLRPGQPGTNQLLVYVLPERRQRAADDIDVKLRLDGAGIALDQCAATCRVATATMHGGETAQVQVGPDPQAVATFSIPALPAASADQALTQAQGRMRQLRTLRIDETLGPANPPVQARYAVRAPDRMSAQSDAGEQVVWIGRDRFNRAAPDQQWHTDQAESALSLPSFMWDALPPRAVRVVGSDTTDGIQSQVVVLSELNRQTPEWFRLWIGADGLIRRSEMWAPRHFMDQRFYAFDEPLVIEAPAALSAH